MNITKPCIYELDAHTYHADPCPVPSLSSGCARKLIDETAGAALQARRNSGAARAAGNAVVGEPDREKWSASEQAPYDAGAPQTDKHRASADRLLARVTEATTPMQLMAITDDAQVRNWRAKRKIENPDIATELDNAFKAAWEALRVAVDGAPPDDLVSSWVTT